MVATADVLRGYREWKDTAGEYEQAEAYAKAQVGEDFANPQVLRIFEKANVNTIEGFAYSSVPIRVISSRLRVLPPSVTRIDSDEPAVEATNALDEICAANDLMAEFKAMFQDVSRDGDAYLFVWPVMEQPVADVDSNGGDDDVDEEGDQPLTSRIVGVDVLVNRAGGVRAVYQQHNRLKMRFVVRIWIDDETGDTRLNLYYHDHVEKWRCEKAAKPLNPEAWIRDPESPNDIPTPLGVMPWFHLRNGRPYGTPEHANAYGPQKMINKLISSLAAVIDFQIGAQRYYMADPTMDDPHQNLTDPDFPEDDNDDPEDGGTSPLSGDPGSVWKLYGRSAGQFEPPNPDNLLKPFERMVQAMAELTGIPAFHFGVGTGNTPSGAALRTLDAPTGEIVDDRKDAYGPPIQRALEHALALLGHTDVRVHLPWRPTTIITDLEGWQILAAKVAAGVPVLQVLIEAGYLSEQASEWVKDANGADLTRRLALLQSVATILQAIAAAGSGAAPAATPPVPPTTPPTTPPDPNATPEAAPPAPVVQPPAVPATPAIGKSAGAAVATLLERLIADIAAGVESEGSADA